VKDKAYVAGFLFVPKQYSVYYRIRKYMVIRAFKSATHLYVYSSKEPEYYSVLLPELSDKFSFMRYGRDFKIFEEDEVKINAAYIASGGASGRDFGTLAKSIKLVSEQIPDIMCIVATRPWSISDVEPTINLKCNFNIRLGSFGSFIDKSLFIILPLQNSILSSGHMTLLEALSRNKVVIVSENNSIRDYVDERSVIFYNSEDYSDLASKILTVYDGIDGEEIKAKAEFGHQLYCNNYTFEAFLNRLLVDINS
jgi:glycosyltransferase involved in cell wall biosynthesis